MGIYKEFKQTLKKSNEGRPSSDHATPLSFLIATLMCTAVSGFFFAIGISVWEMSTTKAALVAVGVFTFLMWLGIRKQFG